MTLHTHTSPKVYSLDNLPDYWIAEGTDGCLYKGPSRPGGWLHGDRFEGQTVELRPVPVEKARVIVWLIYGDTGTVTVAED